MKVDKKGWKQRQKELDEYYEFAPNEVEPFVNRMRAICAYGTKKIIAKK